MTRRIKRLLTAHAACCPNIIWRGSCNEMLHPQTFFKILYSYVASCAFLGWFLGIVHELNNSIEPRWLNWHLGVKLSECPFSAFCTITLNANRRWQLVWCCCSLYHEGAVKKMSSINAVWLLVVGHLLCSIYGSYFAAIDPSPERSGWVAHNSDFPPAAWTPLAQPWNWPWPAGSVVR